MSILLPLTQDDRNRLVQEKERLQEENQLLNDANESSVIEVAEKLLLDVPIKKQTDISHTDIYFYEEELRRLNGDSVIHSIQERGFIINDSVSDARLKINDGRLIVEEGSSEVINLPVIPQRGYSKSTAVGTDFDIWSRDRYGSSTSNINSSSDFTINDTNENLNVEINGVENEISLSLLLPLPIIVSGGALASSIQSLLNDIGIGGFTNAFVGFNETLKTFTITSGTSGLTSTVEVKSASGNDMRTTISFDVQVKITGKYQNNLLNVEIDGTAEEIQIADFRNCKNDVNLGDNNDDIGFQWSGTGEIGYIGNTRFGPLFCSGVDNGKEVAQSIQAKLREVGIGGFEKAICQYFSDEDVFQIYSGTFGSGSSTKVLAASDSDRDARTLLGFNPPQEEVGNEEFFDNIGDLTIKLGTYSNLNISGVGSVDTLSHSILYLSDSGIKIASSFQDFYVMTTEIYDNASRGFGRLYPDGKLVINSSNNKVNLFETLNVERTITLSSGSYAEGEIAIELEDKLGPNYTVDYKSQTKKFVISSTGSFTLLWNSGQNSTRTICLELGFYATDTSHAMSHTSDFETVFGNEDFFNPKFSKQFYSNLPGNQPPIVIDYTIGEEYALEKEEELLTIEDLTSLLSDIGGLTSFDNEVLLDNWEYLASLELGYVNQEYDALRVQRGVYSGHISESDLVVTQKTTALANLILNKDSLNSLLTSHGIINLTQELAVFIPSVDFTEGGNQQLTINVPAGSDDKRFYNKPSPLVRYASGGNHLPGRWNPVGLFISGNVVYTPEGVPLFTLTNTRTATEGYSYSTQEPSGEYSILYGSDQPASVLSSNSETYDLSSGDELKMKILDGDGIENGSEQTATFDATAGYTESTIAVSDKFLIVAGVNDKIDFDEGGGELTATLTPGEYSGVSLATEIKTQLDSIGGLPVYTVTYAAMKFTITSNGAGGAIFSLLWNTGSSSGQSSGFSIGFDVSSDDIGLLSYVSDYNVEFNILTGVNDEFTIEIDGVSSVSAIVISQGIYIDSTLLIEMAIQIANDVSFSVGDFTVTYPASKFRITSTIKGTDSTIVVTEGANDFLRMVELDGDVPVVGGGDVGNIDAVTAAEIASVLNADITGISGSDDSGSVRITTSSSDGGLSSVEITGGSARTIIGFDLTTMYGENQKTGLKVDIDSDTSKNPIQLTTSVSPISGVTVASDIQTKLQAIGGGGYAGALCTFNEQIAWEDLTNKLRIISGTQGVASKVLITDKTIVISAANNKIDFDEGGGEITATLVSGTYNSSSLVLEIQGKLNGAGGSNYTVAVLGSGKVSISSDGTGGTFSLLWNTGTNSANNVAKTIGFRKVDRTGTLTYSGEGLVKTNNIYDELGFDSQTAVDGDTVTGVTTTKTGNSFSLKLINVLSPRIELFINMTIPPNDKIDGLISTINSVPYYVGTRATATLLGRVSELFRIDDNDTLIINANGGGNQTVTFVVIRGKSESGVNPYTRIVGDSNDRIQISLNGATFKEIILGSQPNSGMVAAKIQQEVRALVPELVITVGVNDKIDFDEGIGQITAVLTPGTYTESSLTTEIKNQLEFAGVSTYTVTYTTNKKFVLTSSLTGGATIFSLLWNTGTNSAISVGVTIGFDTSADDSGFLTYTADNTVELNRAAYSLFTCTYVGGKYVLESGTGGTVSSCVVINATTNNGAVVLKLGIGNGGAETLGSGDFIDSTSATLAEIIVAINNIVPVGFSVAGPDYLEISSTVTGSSSRIQVSGTTLTKLGFDSNDDSGVGIDLATINSVSMRDFTDKNIKSLVTYSPSLGWDINKGDVEITYYTTDDSEILPRDIVVDNRLPTITTRKPQITARVTNVIAAMTASLYEDRRDAVDMRLNKNTGTYVKVGDEFNSQDTNDESIANNTNTINEIDGIL